MLIVVVDIAITPGQVNEFLRASIDNATASLSEPGVIRFDVVQDQADPTHALLIEVYTDADAVAAHKQTEHYAAWRDAVAPMMARPRTSQKFSAAFPVGVQDWRTPR